MSNGCFIPHPECMVPTGDCFTKAKCLAECKKRSFYTHQSDLKNIRHEMSKLEARILKLEAAK